MLIPYEVTLPSDVKVVMSPEDHHEGMDWFTLAEAAKLLAVKYTPDFCALVAALEEA